MKNQRFRCKGGHFCPNKVKINFFYFQKKSILNRKKFELIRQKINFSEKIKCLDKKIF